MRIVYQNVAGLDVHKKVVVAASRVLGTEQVWQEAHRTFGTMTADLLVLSDWLMAQGVQHVALESTGEYWKPVFNILEANFNVILVNAHQLSKVPGRKTDQSDAQWIAELLQYGLLKASFIPPHRATGTSRVDARPQQFCPGTIEFGQPAAEGIGKREHQVGERGR